jgi:hypothetical protein
LAIPWALMALPQINIDNSIVAESIQKHAAAMGAVVHTATRELQRRGQATQGEAVMREGLTAAEMAARSVRCIFGFNMGNNDGCAEIANVTCKTCTAICCEFHQTHELHKDFAIEKFILRQRQAQAQQKPAFLEGAPQMAPAKESTTGENTSAPKRVRKNTWPDLESRYQKIKGETYVRPPGQKVRDFQLMVEGLEARARGVQVPESRAQAKDIVPSQVNNPPPAGVLSHGLVPESISNGLQFLHQLQLFLASQTSTISSQNPPRQAKLAEGVVENSDEEDVEVYV